MSNSGRIAYFYDSDMGNYYYAPNHPMKPQRLRLTHNLLLAYKLYRYLEVFKPHRATKEEMMKFHTKEYIDFLHKINPFNAKDYIDDFERFSIPSGVDNPIFDGMFNYCSLYCGASLDAASRLNQGYNQICVNWSGGLHHAKKAEASGFCYVNDIVLAILELLKVHPRVMYIDIDIHHGDGVEEAFYCTDRVMTVSFHKYGNYFPGTGSKEEVGHGKGKYYSVNVPLKDGITDENYQYVFDKVITTCISRFQPNAIVLQCGADSIAGDRLGTFNMTLRGHAHCVEFVRSFNIPMLVLGGGGYTIRNVSRAWAYETSVLLNKDIPDTIPMNNYLEWYAPTYKLHLTPIPSLEDKNTISELDELYMTVSENLRQTEAVPSVEFTSTPDVWNKENVQQIQQEIEEDKGGEEEEGKEEIANGLNEQVENEGEFYEGVHDN